MSAVLSWILYDFADTIYSMNVVSLYFGPWLIVDLARQDTIVSFANSISMILVALTMPFLGEISDQLQRKLPFLAILTFLCISATAGIGLLGQNVSQFSLFFFFIPLLYVIANYSYQSALVFYNALMPSVSTPKTIGRISGYGVAIGYLGAAFGIMAVQPFVEGWYFDFQMPYTNQVFQVPILPAGGKVAAFVPSALLFMLFALPLFIFVKEANPKINRTKISVSFRSSLQKVFDGLMNTRKFPGVRRFLIAHFLYSDSIETIILFMAVYSQVVVGFTSAETSLFFVGVIPAAVIGSAFAGILTDHYGAKKTLVGVIFGWIICLLLVIFTNSRLIFWILGAFIGIFMGSTWTASRPLLISLVPEKMLGEFFGLYALAGKVAAIIGPILWSTVTQSLSDYSDPIRYKSALGALLVLMLAGLTILFGVPDHHRSRAPGDQK